jgi:hypothetical protein
MGGGGKEHKRGVPRPPPLSLYRDWEEVEAVKITSKQSQLGRCSSMHQDKDGSHHKKKLTKQLSMKETTREVKWEKRRRQIQRRRSSTALNECDGTATSSFYPVDGAEPRSSVERVAKGRLTDEDLDELRGSMELGFGFDEEKGGQNLCDTLPALDLYFAVNRQLSEPKMRWSTSSAPSPSATSPRSNLCGTPGPRSPSVQSNLMDSWKICSPGNVRIRIDKWYKVIVIFRTDRRGICSRGLYL